MQDLIMQGRLAFDCYEARKDDPEVRVCWEQSRLLLGALEGRRSSIFCPLCRAADAVDFGAAGFDTREQLLCPTCRLNARIRAGIGLLEEAGTGTGRIYMTEQATPAFAWMQKRHPGLSGSEFEPDAAARLRLGEYLQSLGGEGPVVFRDITALDYPDAGLDAVLSFDVLEHVPDYRQALREFARVIRPGGSLVATFPFTDGAATIVRARHRQDGSLEHVLEPEYHGDPISGGVLCYYHFGWDVLDAVREAGFASARMVMPWAPHHGLFYGLWTLVATR